MSWQGIKVLVVAEDELTRFGLRLLLRNTGGVGAVTEADRAPDVPGGAADADSDVAIVDAVRMGPGEAIRLIDDLTARRPDLPVMVYTEDPAALAEHCRRQRVRCVCLARGRRSGEALRRAIAQVVEGHVGRGNGADRRPGGTDEAALVATLTAREREVLCLVAAGEGSRRIAEVLGVSLRTVESHRSKVCAKLGVRSVAALTKVAVKTGLTSLAVD